MNIQPITLEGRSARLEPLDDRHADDLSMVATPDLLKYTFRPPEYTPEGWRQVIAFVNGMAHMQPFAIIECATNRAIGITTYLDIRANDRGLEIGFTWLGARYQGTKINPECKYMLLRHAFEQQDAMRVQLKTDARNLQSQRAIEKLGAVKEGILRRHMILQDGHVRDTVMYSIINDEWPAVKQRLEERLEYIP